MRRYYLSLTLVCALLSGGCYEDRLACLDPDASNYDLRADDQCPDDCCQYPNFIIEVTGVVGDAPFSVDSIYRDGAGTEFRVLRLRFYVGEVLLLAGDQSLAAPANAQQIGRLVAGDTVTTDINANVGLVSATGSATLSIGTFRSANQSITGLSATVGLPFGFDDLIPSTAPASSPLRIQQGLLNFNDGRGYVSASMQYVLTETNDTLRADAYRDEPIVLDLPVAVAPARGSNLALLLETDYQALFDQLDLRASPTALDADIAPSLRLTGAR